MLNLTSVRVVLPLCGGNIDTTLLGRCLDRGLAADGRLITFNVVVSDRPGGIADLTKLIPSVGVSIKDIVQERAWVRTDAFAVGVKILAETRNRKHSRELFKMLRETYDDVQVTGFYDSPEDYVSGNLHGETFEHVEEETPFEGDMNNQYNADIIEEDARSFDEDMTSSSPDEGIDSPLKHSMETLNLSHEKSSKRVVRNY